MLNMHNLNKGGHMSVMSVKKVPSISQDLKTKLFVSSSRTQMSESKKKNFLAIINRLHTATKLEEILFEIAEDIIPFFQTERLSIYMVDGIKRQLISRIKKDDEKMEIRLPISPESIAGYVAFKQKMVNIKDAYDDTELKNIDPALCFDKKWDQLTGFKTKQVLATPIIFQKYFLGVIQFLNTKNDTGFTTGDEQISIEMARAMGIALYNQKQAALKKNKPRYSHFDYLVQKQIISPKDLEKAIDTAKKREEEVATILIKEYNVSKKDIAKSLSNYYKVPFEKFNQNTPIPVELLYGIKIPFLRKNRWVPLRTENDRIIIAIDDPNDLQRLDDVKSLFKEKFKNYKLDFHVALKEDIKQYINLFTQTDEDAESIDSLLDQLKKEEFEIEEMEETINEEDSVIVQLVNKIILDAYARGASDIHIEPQPGKNKTVVRLRIDGECILYQTIPYHYRNAIVSRLKIMSDLDIADKRKPQDGKIKFKKYGGKDVDLRIATIPTQGAMEDVVMRILSSGEPIPLDLVGFSKTTYNKFVNCIKMPYGIALVVGPTGSGKTTTLHSALGYINKPEIKIWTAEDPVEIVQKGLRQVQIESKFGVSFASTMRAFLRADPDVIMVGEMRDKETTQIGIEASLTGHLVFSTLHTNSAPETISRLLDMGMDPFNFADALLCILAQRLARKLCTNCKQQYHPSIDEYNELVHEYDKIAFEKHLNIPYTDDLILFKAKGCHLCNNTGYKGRMGLFELLIGNDEIKKLIQFKTPIDKIRTQAINDGMTTLKQDGIEKIFTGHLDLLQVRKVCIK